MSTRFFIEFGLKSCFQFVYGLMAAILFSHELCAQIHENQKACFYKNQGQWDESIHYQASTNGSQVRFLSNCISYGISRALSNPLSFNLEDDHKTFKNNGASEILDNSTSTYEHLVWNMCFLEANKHAMIKSVSERASKIHYLKGNDSSKWIKNNLNAQEILYNDIYPRIDLRYYLRSASDQLNQPWRIHGQGDKDILNPANYPFNQTNESLKYDFIIHPGGEINNIVLQYQGIENLSLNQNGQLVIQTAWDTYIEEAPYSYQTVRGKKKEVLVKYEIIDEFTFGFKTQENYDHAIPLIIDPISLIWSTYMAVTAANTANYSTDIVIDSDGNSYVTGYCDNSLPVTPGVFQPIYGGSSNDCFIAKLNGDGSDLIYSTYIGGSDFDQARKIVINDLRQVFITGVTLSTDYPTTFGSIQPNNSGSNDAFVTCLNSNGTGLVFSTYLGGIGVDYAFAIALDDAKEVYVTGQTKSLDFPTLNPYQSVYGGGAYDVFVSKLTGDGGSLIYSTFIGGSSIDYGTVITTDSDGDAYVAGVTNSTDFPMLSAFQNSFNGGTFDGFILKLNSEGNDLNYSSYLGGNAFDNVKDIIVSADKNAYVVGATKSIGLFPILNAYQSVHSLGNNWDGFATCLGSAGNLLFSTFLGGQASDYIYGIALNDQNEIYLSGTTESTNFPITSDAYQASKNGYTDLFLIHFDSTLTTMACGGATYIGGSRNDYMAAKIAIDNTGSADTLYLAATTHSDDFPVTPGAYSTIKTNPGDYDQPVLLKLASCNICEPVFTENFNPDCNGDIDGSIIASGQGTGPWNYVWTNEIGTILQSVTSMDSDSLLALGAGTYTITATDSKGCESNHTTTITEPAVLTATFTADSANCGQNDGSVNVAAEGGSPPYTYQWNDIDNQTTSDASGLSPDNYNLILTDNVGCDSTFYVTIGDKSGPELFLENSVFCYGLNTLLSAGIPNMNYLWSPGGATTESILVSDSGKYHLTITDTSTGCANTDSLKVTVFPSPEIHAIPNDTNIYMDQTIQVIANGGVSYEWVPETGLDKPNASNPTVNPNLTFGLNPLIYQVTGTDLNGCKGIDSVVIYIESEDFSIFIPNSFTPDGNYKNPQFEIKGKGISRFHISIYNRWGGLVFESNSINHSWNGENYGDMPVPEDTYVYVVKVTSEMKDQRTYIGKVSVIR